MKVLCFSSFNFAYLNRARVLFASVRRYHPDWHIVALITDRVPDGFDWDISNEPIDEVVYADELAVDGVNGWLFKHDVVEVCTAVKGPYLLQACSSGVDVVVYLDPDTCLFAPITPVLQILKTSDIVLTPHQTVPDAKNEAIIDNEITSLKTGIYNLGFLAIRTTGEGLRMAQWWSDRLKEFCYDDIPNGLFVDQRWCDHVPSFFNGVHILRDPGYNVASWNLSHRTVTMDAAGGINVNGQPLRFWHFTKLGPLGDTMTKRYAKDNFQVYELWNWYRRQVIDATAASIPSGYWYYGAFESGRKIHKSYRLLYRHRKDLQEAFPDPYKSGAAGFEAWLANEGLLQEAGSARGGNR
ncbi:hypothetical protein ACFPIF_10505 [Brevundimonas faecalis]|uniref:hypothetical protein n=1 Tax=Brevundimonas faecalis TaxID=947378 RepID=UPI003609352F